MKSLLLFSSLRYTERRSCEKRNKTIGDDDLRRRSSLCAAEKPYIQCDSNKKLYLQTSIDGIFD